MNILPKVFWGKGYFFDSHCRHNLILDEERDYNKLAISAKRNYLMYLSYDGKKVGQSLSWLPA